MPNGVEIFNPVGRVVPFVPLSGKYGYVSIGGKNLNLAKWAPDQTADPLPVTNFNSPRDANYTVHSESVIGVANTTFTLHGVQDGSNNAYRPTVGDTGYGVMGYSAALFFSITFLVTKVGGECSIDGVSALEFSIKANGLCLMTGRNGGA